MTADTATITSFITDRLDADEAAAEQALERGFGGWEWLADHGINFEARTHIARHHPAHVLRTVAALRAIVELHREDAPHLAGQQFCTTCHDYNRHDGVEWPCPTIRALAAIWSDSDEWREEWR